MLTVIATANIAIALFCFMLSWQVAKFGHRILQLNRDLHHWTVLLENTLTQQTLAFSERRAQLRQGQLLHLQWQLQQQRLTQTAKFLRLIWLISQRRFP